MTTKLKKNLAILFTFALVVSMFLSNFNVKAYATGGCLDKTHSDKSAEERYIESLAEKQKITVDEAKRINEEENKKVLAKYQSLNKKSTEEIKYKTVCKDFRIDNTSRHDTSQHVEMAVEVKYVYSNADREPVEIIGIDKPSMYAPNSYTVNGGDFNIEINPTSVRISRTAVVSPPTRKNVIFHHKSSSGKTKETTRAKTYVFNIKLNTL